MLKVVLSRQGAVNLELVRSEVNGTFQMHTTKNKQRSRKKAGITIELSEPRISLIYDA